METSKDAKGFIFLEILDPDLSGLIIALRNIFGDKPPKTQPHITLRGPYVSMHSLKKRIKIINHKGLCAR